MFVLCGHFYLVYIRLFHKYASACGSLNIDPCDIHWVYFSPISHPTAAASSTDLLILSKIRTLYSSLFLYQGNSLTSDKIRSVFFTMASAAASAALYRECGKCQKCLQFNMTLCQVRQLAARVFHDYGIPNCGILVMKLISEHPQLSIANIYELPAFSKILSAINIAYVAAFRHSVDTHTDQ